jgi:asparagine synthetase B (glutamine-hydrolysing)
MAVDVLGGIGASRLHALSLGFPDQDSEEFEQRAVAKSLGLEHEFVPFYDAVPGRMLEATLAHVRGLPAPLLNPWTPAYAHLAMRARRWGTRVILTGHGGDEWLGVSPFLSADLMRAGDLGRLLRFFASHRRSCNIPTHRAMRTIFWQFGLRPVASSLLERAAPRAWTARRTRRSVGGLQSWLAPDPSLRAAIEARVERAMPPATPPRSFYFRDIRQMIEHPLVAMELEESFEMGRRLGFLFARPYWDGDVVDILYRAPPQVLLAGGRSKGVVRATMAKRFPGLGLDRQRKRIATTFFASVVTRQVPDMWRANPTLSGLAGLGIVNLAGVRRMADRAIAKRDRHNLVRLWYLMNTDAWVAAHA